MPAMIPDTLPLLLTVAVVTGLLLHTPPAVISPNPVDDPAHTLSIPLMAAGDACTVTVLVTVQPVPNEYVIRVVAPGSIPVTIPLDEPMVAAVTVPLLHAPPPTGSVSAVVAPAHTVDEPTIAVGAVLTVTVVPVAQPVGSV